VNRHTDGRSEAGGQGALSPKQKRQLILLAREAWAKRAEPVLAGVVDECPFDVPAPAGAGEDFDAWRHAECMMAVERPGLSACRNEDYLPLKAHFLRLLGRHEEAEALDAKALVDPRNRAMHEFQRACMAAAGVLDNPLAYAEGFLRRACGVSLDEASDTHIWRAVYLLRRKAGLEKRKGGGE
jgi:hypothetical protein